MIEFFHMGGYAFHVWSSWGASALALGTLFFIRASRLKKARALSAQVEHDETAG